MQEAFERAILANPDDLVSYAVYADWLEEQGDPRGEFIHVQLALENEEQPREARGQLRAREQALLQAHQTEWLGGLAPFLLGPGDRPASFAFARGWLDQLTVRSLDLDFAAALAKAPQAQLLRTLRISRLPPPGIPCPLRTLAESPHLGNVRLFQLGDENGHVLAPQNDIAALVGRFSRLEELYLHAGGRYPEELFSSASLSCLRHLIVRGDCSDACEALASNEALRHLSVLSLDPTPDEDHELPFEGVRVLLRSRHLRRLERLRLHGCENGDRLCRLIVRSPLLPRLRELGLVNSRITIRGVAALVSSGELAGLELLDLSGNHLGRRGLNLLSHSGINYLADNQGRPEDDEYYDSVQE
jgi:uncharacterized protein (TIGR02996 family)